MTVHTLNVYQRVKAHKVNAVTYDKAHFLSLDNKKKLQMILKLVPPLLPPSADKISQPLLLRDEQTA